MKKQTKKPAKKAAKAKPAAAKKPVKGGKVKPQKTLPLPDTSTDFKKFLAARVPANWNGSKEQFVALHAALEEGFVDQARRAFAKLYPEMARVACKKLAEMENPVAEVDFAIKLDFTSAKVASLSGSAKFKEETKHSAEIKFSRDIEQAELDLAADATKAETPAPATPASS